MALVEHVYGRPLAFRYIPLAGDSEYMADSLVSARLYGPNSYPSTEQIEDAGMASSGHVGARVTSWDFVNEEGTGAAEYVVVFPALTDATPSGGSEYDFFYVALNYRAESGGDILRDVEQILVYRPDGLTSKIRVTAQDVYAIESRIEDFADSVLWTEAKVDAAIEELLSRLEGRGYRKRRLFNLEKLNAAAKRLACAYCCMDLAGEGNQFWMAKATLYRQQADKLFEIAQVGFDSAGNDAPSPDVKVQGGAVTWTR
jgi:hypothetical protein